jgi:hypothetical protein
LQLPAQTPEIGTGLLQLGVTHSQHLLQQLRIAQHLLLVALCWVAIAVGSSMEAQVWAVLLWLLQQLLEGRKRRERLQTIT